jgi:hypothetical protein
VNRAEPAPRAVPLPESWRQLAWEVNGNRPFDGQPGVRDADAPCDDFDGKAPNGSGRCAGDGHYLCSECSQYKPEDEDE